ncbi:ferredoxin reductase family protein [Roseinatronobacter sp. NSM]|uniref:ferredoxin reductase family protein n=1 Tax=Roseinatronobacter sp. NSM TaxID=3457785 RepID=UPI004035592C
MTDPSCASAAAHTRKARQFQPRHDRRAVVIGHALGVLALGVLALGLPFAVVVFTAPAAPSGGLIWDFSMGLGFGALAMVTLQFALTGRLRWVTHPFGADIVYLAHRYLSWGALLLMGAHFALLYVFHQPALGVLNPFQARWELTAGRVALLCFAALVVTSQWRRALGLRYEWWRGLHLVLAITGFMAAIAHVLGVGTLTGTPQKRVLWLGVTLGWLGLLVFTRIIRPWLQTRNPWRVVGTHDEGGGVRRLELAPEGRALTRWKPGQFAWLTVGHSPFGMVQHPFTISTAPEHGPNLSFAIKALGDHSRAFAQTQIGARAYVDGPYGAFSVDRMTRATGFVMIAGGVGITPVMANLHALAARRDRRPVIVLYANPSWDKVAFRDDLERLRKCLNMTLVHVLDDPPEGWDGERGQIDFDILTRHLAADTRDWPHLLCGPGPMIASLRADLQRLGVRDRHMDYEIFELV